MSDKPEPLAAVLAEMRASSLSTVRAWADRIKAAAERERYAHTNDIHDALYKATAPGNAAALREALEEIYNEAQNICDYCDEQRIVSHRADKIERIVNTALAAPARNCDRFQNWHDAMREEYFTRSTPENVKGYPYGDEKRWREFCDWLFAAAEGGDHA